jgi:type I restriction enzyme R subunit
VNIVKQNATIDWTTGEHVQAKMRLAVKRILNKYGYPPDAQSLAELRVMETANAIAAELVIF